MKISSTNLSGCIVIEPTIVPDGRGYFMESFNERNFGEAVGKAVHFVQDNQSFSTYGVLRGLHYQTADHAQAKLVRVITGEVLDVVVDVRPESATFGQSFSIVLSAENQKQLFVPRGFAHGFVVLSETATFFYKCDNFYNKESEGGIKFNDPELAIDWMLSESDLKISDKDQNLPLFAESRRIW